jgi:diguanylate cyclase (GGDEF)-like protein
MCRSFVRTSDFAARYGGEEFVVLSSGMEAAKAGSYSEVLCRRVRELAIAHEKSSVSEIVTISVGHATRVPAPHDTAETLIAEADKALCKAKRGGRNRAEHL